MTVITRLRKQEVDLYRIGDVSVKYLDCPVCVISAVDHKTGTEVNLCSCMPGNNGAAQIMYLLDAALNASMRKLDLNEVQV